ncbi:MAG TPA: heparan-alpha-glucosaminide N-acetyltransferase domain-containing protein, partial [Flavitalea sp.]|nr:heparan-alpha-glucosaminide N-acetyltransferase domain-containing protein [Flavitalea sp.]
VRDFFSYTTYRPDDVTQASVFLFFTRWITHFCAPTFVFLSGISMYLYCKKAGSRKKTSVFLLTRGFWLIAVEILIISFILTQGYQLTLLEVIWTIGCSMVLLAALIWLPRWLQVILSLVMIAGHNALPMIEKVTSGNIFFAFLHNTPFFIDEPPVLVAYTIVPWVGVMLLGYAIGSWFLYPPQKRDKLLLRTGIVALVFFLVFRFLNIYGDPSPWSIQERGGIYTLLSFLKVSKYPPSLLFLCITLGISCILLVFAEKISTTAKKILSNYGRVPFFFFIVHLAVISCTSWLWTYISFGKGVNLSFESAKNWPAEYHPSLLRAYFVWVMIIIALYFPCLWYGRYKAKNRAWWVSYL